jgi:hypothetical protein
MSRQYLLWGTEESLEKSVRIFGNIAKNWTTHFWIQVYTATTTLRCTMEISHRPLTEEGTTCTIVVYTTLGKIYLRKLRVSLSNFHSTNPHLLSIIRGRYNKSIWGWSTKGLSLTSFLQFQKTTSIRSSMELCRTDIGRLRPRDGGTWGKYYVYAFI